MDYSNVCGIKKLAGKTKVGIVLLKRRKVPITEVVLQIPAEAAYSV